MTNQAGKTNFLPIQDIIVCKRGKKKYIKIARTKGNYTIIRICPTIAEKIENNVVIYSPSIPAYDKSSKALERVKEGRNGIYYTPSLSYINNNKFIQNIKFHLNKRSILGNTSFLDNILGKLYQIQVNE